MVKIFFHQRRPAPPLPLSHTVQAAGRENRNFLGKGRVLRDNDFNPGGLAIWHGIGQMHRYDPFEAEAIAAVSQAGYFALQRLVNRALYGSPIRHDTIH
jgi:hypothetical protein